MRDFEQSWLGSVHPDLKDDWKSQYVSALYFVTTTITTCGFGDFYAVHYDGVELLSVTALQFVGLLFYSYTIDKIQTLLTSE